MRTRVYPVLTRVALGKLGINPGATRSSLAGATTGSLANAATSTFAREQSFLFAVRGCSVAPYCFFFSETTWTGILPHNSMTRSPLLVRRLHGQAGGRPTAVARLSSLLLAAGLHSDTSRYSPRGRSPWEGLGSLLSLKVGCTPHRRAAATATRDGYGL
jgi:hypothetical protein